MSGEENKEFAKDWKLTSERTDAIHYILAAVDCPQSVRGLINILVGISEGQLEFESSRKAISSRIKSTLVNEDATQSVKRAHRQLRKWQKEYELNLIEYKPGYKDKDTGALHKSRYYLHILPIADEVIAYAQKDKLWAKDKSKALEIAALDLKPNFSSQDFKFNQRGSYKLADYKEIEKYVRTGITNLRKAMDILDRDKSTILLERRVIDELEQTLEELKKRLWYQNMINKGE